MEKVIQTLRSTYRSYVELKLEYDTLQEKYQSELSKNSLLLRKIKYVLTEQNTMKQELSKFDCVKKYFGKEQINKIISTVKKQEQSQKSESSEKHRNTLKLK